MLSQLTAKPARLAFAAIAVVLLAAGVWTIIWWRATVMAQTAIDNWRSAEARRGNTYRCASLSISGYPFRIEVRCAGVEAELASAHPAALIRTPAVTVVAQIYDPSLFIGEITGPLTVAVTGQPPSLAADWTRARLVVSGVPPQPDTFSIALDDPHLERAAGGEPLFNARRAQLDSRIIEGTPRDHPVLDITLHLAEASAPHIHPLLAQATDGDVDAIVRGMSDLSPKPWAERLREMQGAGGGIEIKSLRLTQANAVVVGTGTLGLSPEGKLNGVIRVAVAGIEQIVPQLGIDRMIGQGIDQLAGGSGTLERLVPGLSDTIRDTANASVIENLKKMGEPTTIDGRRAILLPLRFVNGTVYLGMLRIGEAPALF